jgi:hypothetical protein
MIFIAFMRFLGFERFQLITINCYRVSFGISVEFAGFLAHSNQKPLKFKNFITPKPFNATKKFTSKNQQINSMHLNLKQDTKKTENFLSITVTFETP